MDDTSPIHHKMLPLTFILAYTIFKKGNLPNKPKLKLPISTLQKVESTIAN
jgi:hypothetical protein